MQRIERTETQLREAWQRIWTDNYVFEPINYKHDTISMLVYTALGKIRETTGVFLDVGSGPGSRTIPSLKEFPQLKLVLLDASQEALAKAKDFAFAKGVHADFVRGDAFEIPLPDCSVECVFSNGFNEHFIGAERQQLFNEMARVAKIGGSIVIITPNKLNPFHTLNKIIQEKRGSWIYGPQYDFIPGELIHRMENAGLSHIEVYGAGAYTSWVRLLPRNVQRGLVISPTPISSINNILHNLDAQVDSKINRLFGREIMVIGRK